MRKILILLTTALFFFTSVNTILAQLSSKQIDSLAERALSKFKVVGAAIAVVKDGKIIHQKGYGITSISNGSPVNEFTNFEIASNSKAFTTTALSILVEEGKINWTDKVIDHIPEFRMYNDYVTSNFTIQDLLTHRSGLGLGVGDLMVFPDSSNFTMKDVIKCFQYFQPTSAFRTKFDYDNMLYLVAGEVIARISGVSYEDFVQKRIFVPLQMTHTIASISKLTDKNNTALPHSTDAGLLKSFSLFSAMPNGAAGGLLSNVADMSKWMMVHLNKGKYGDSSKLSLFSADNHYEMWRLHTIIPTVPGPRYETRFYGYGLGWFLNDKTGKFIASHTGGLPGMSSIVSMIPDLNLGIVILTNTEPGGGEFFTAINNTISDSYLGVKSFQWVDTISKYSKLYATETDTVVRKVWAQVSLQKNSKIKFEDYVGIYEDKWFGKIEVFKKENQLWFKAYRSPKLLGQMFFYNANTFAIKFQYRDLNCDAFASFFLDETGKAQSLKMKGISPDIDFSYDFQDLDLKRAVDKN